MGIFPYVLKLLQSSARELRPLLVFIWAKILAVDSVSSPRRPRRHEVGSVRQAARAAAAAEVLSAAGLPAVTPCPLSPCDDPAFLVLLHPSLCLQGQLLPPSPGTAGAPPSRIREVRLLGAQSWSPGLQPRHSCPSGAAGRPLPAPSSPPAGSDPDRFL